MAQPAVMGQNGNHALDGTDASAPVAPGKRKRDASDEGEDNEVKGATTPRDQKELVERCFEALKRYVGVFIWRVGIRPSMCYFEVRTKSSCAVSMSNRRC